MKRKNSFFLLVGLILLGEVTYAQQPIVKIDSVQIYTDIESYSKRSRFTKFIYSLVFIPVSSKSIKNKSKTNVYKKLNQNPYRTFEGKIIRQINIETIDPFGYSITDTGKIPRTIINKTINKLHVKSQQITIRNLLMIHKNQKLNSFLVKESERLIRSQGYVRDVLFTVIATSENSDSVDVNIRELDNWSIIPKIDGSTSNVTFVLTDRNFLGLGHNFQNGYTQNYLRGTNSFNTKYFIPNIRNTYINSTLHYEIDEQRNFSRNISIDRPFFSPLAKWAAGAFIGFQYKKDSLKNLDLIYVPFQLKFKTQDIWSGVAIPIFNSIDEEYRATNLILIGRFLRIRYLENPIETVDVFHEFSNENFYLTSFGISTRKYIKDNYIFKYGITEDVPIGRVYGITGGYQIKNNKGRLYFGARYSSGNYYPWGYLSSNFEYGTFFTAYHATQGVLTIGLNYFTELFTIGNWKMRQFIKPRATFGINRFSSDSLTINNQFGLDGFNSSALSGTNRILITLQTQAYTPWNIIGFRLGPFFTYSLGMLGDGITGFRKSRVYSQIGFGMLIKNENLILNAFQLSIAFYPSIPGIGNNVMKINSFKTTDLGFRDFEIGKPSIVLFQ